MKNHGSYFGIDHTGSYVADTRYANDGSLQGSGAEPAPPTDATLGNQAHRLHAMAQHVTEFYDMSTPTAPVLALQELLTASQKLLQFSSQPADFLVADAAGSAMHLQQSGPATMATIGNGAVHPAIAEHLQALYTQLYTWLTTHTHPTAVGISGPPIAPTPPPWDPTINSTHVSMPDL